MIKEFLLPKGEFNFGEGNKGKVFTRDMEQPELSLGASLSLSRKSMAAFSSSCVQGANTGRKRKKSWDEPFSQTSVELQLSNEPLPQNWEQCLDLQSGRMHYLNRKTKEKSCIRPKEEKHSQNISLELNMSIIPTLKVIAKSSALEEQKKRMDFKGSMVAAVCINCHLLVMLCKSSPSCPNCKHMHRFLLTASQAPPLKIDGIKPVETLSFLH